jgi:hypothetical protein
MSVADPEQTKLRILVPVTDAGLFTEGDKVKIHPDSEPLKSYPATITRIGFDVVMSENKVPSILVEAEWAGDPPSIQPGQRGVAKIEGPDTRLGMQILRKPLIALRNLIGF